MAMRGLFHFEYVMTAFAQILFCSAAKSFYHGQADILMSRVAGNG